MKAHFESMVLGPLGSHSEKGKISSMSLYHTQNKLHTDYNLLKTYVSKKKMWGGQFTHKDKNGPQTYEKLFVLIETCKLK